MLLSFSTSQILAIRNLNSQTFHHRLHAEPVPGIRCRGEATQRPGTSRPLQVRLRARSKSFGNMRPQLATSLCRRSYAKPTGDRSGLRLQIFDIAKIRDANLFEMPRSSEFQYLLLPTS
jgi:hypothetical protein